MGWAQCRDCSKWRRHPASTDVPESFTCNLNTWRPDEATCSAVQDVGAPGRPTSWTASQDTFDPVPSHFKIVDQQDPDNDDAMLPVTADAFPAQTAQQSDHSDWFYGVFEARSSKCDNTWHDVDRIQLRGEELFKVHWSSQKYADGGDFAAAAAAADGDDDDNEAESADEAEDRYEMVPAVNIRKVNTSLHTRSPLFLTRVCVFYAALYSTRA